jgi:hypothetical protein
MAQHTTLVVAVTIVLASALAVSAFAQATGRGNSPGGSPGGTGPGRGGPGVQTYYPGDDTCVGNRCDQQRKPKTLHSDRCSPTVTNGKPVPQDCHPPVPPKP